MMDPDTSFTEVDLKQEKFEDVKEDGKKFSCDLCDKEMVHKMALVLLEGLSTACVDNTTGDMFKSPGTVAAEIRKEMLEYITMRSESFVAESFLLQEDSQEQKPDQPSDIVSDFLEEFAGLKRNMFSRVSGWLLSDMREDKIDDFVQEMELNSFWLLDKREAISQTLLKNVDFKNEFHCNMKFKSEEELKQHRPRCGFRTVLCRNEGCSTTFSAAQLEQHDSICPFKMLPCEQKCPEILMRQEMDRHCVTVCPMKLVTCPFYSIGCQATIPSTNIKEHCLDNFHFHLLYALRYLHKGVSAEDLTPRADQIEQESSGLLTGKQGVRSFTNAVKDLDLKLGPLEVVKKNLDYGEITKKLISEASEGENKSNVEQLPAEYIKKSKLEQPPAEDMKASDAEHTVTAYRKKSDSELSLPKGPMQHEQLAVGNLNKPDTGQLVTEDMENIRI